MMQSTPPMMLNTKIRIVSRERLTLRKTTLRALSDDALRGVAGGDSTRIGFCRFPETQAPDPGTEVGGSSATQTR
jgi:hypothetical protein